MKMRKLISMTTVAWISALCLVSCQKNPPEKHLDAISISQEDLFFNSGEGQTESVDVECTGEWQIENFSEGMKVWLEADTLGGNGNGTINFRTTESNPYDRKRMAVLKFVSGEASNLLVITQQPNAERSISLSEDKLDFGCAPDTMQLEIITARSWSVDTVETPLPSWLKLSATKGETGRTIDVCTIGTNEDIEPRSCRIVVRIDRVHYVEVVVTQASGLEIGVSPEKLDFGGTEADSKSVVVTTNTSKYAWEVEGYTEEVRKWLNLNIVTAAALHTEITVSTLGANKTGNERKAELKFKLSDGVKATLNVCQEKKPATLKKISWTGESKVQTITAPPGKEYSFLPYTTGIDPSQNPVWTDGPDGKEIYEGYFKATRDYVFKMDTTANVGSSYTLELGPSTTETKCFYGNFKIHAYSGYRTRNAYIKIPAIEGFKLTGVKVVCGNETDKTSSVAIGKDTAISPTTGPTAENVLGEKSQLTLGKNTPVDVSITQAEANTSYYLFITQDRLITGFTFTYSEVE